MDLAALIAALSRPDAFLESGEDVVVHQTHISAVFLTGEFAYKLKKPVNLGFLDFTTLELRRHYCEEETRLNRRLAPDVYLGVLPVTDDGGTIRVNGPGAVIDWVVQMVRLPDSATLLHRLSDNSVSVDEFRSLAERIAAFHRCAEVHERTIACGRFTVVAANARENFSQSRAHIGQTVSERVFTRVQELTELSLVKHRNIMESRADRGIPRDTHGDLRLEHVYWFPDRPAPQNWAVIDCIEFAERFRYADPLADAGFLVMDLLVTGHPGLASAFADAYLAASGDESEGRLLLPFYIAYRAVVRAKVEGITATETEIPAVERTAARFRGRAYWLLALGQLERPARRPGLVLIGGLPGTGKSTLARSLAEASGFTVIRSDVVRKELAGVSGSAASGFHEGIYSPEWTERVYAECLRRANEMLCDGQRVIVDATFQVVRHRGQFLEQAKSLAVPAVFVVCETPPDLIRQRLAARTGDTSDADWSIAMHAAETWTPAGPDSVTVDTTDRDTAHLQAIHALALAGLA